MSLFEQFNNVGVTLLIASHDLEMITPMRRRTLVLEKGRLLRDDPAGESR